MSVMDLISALWNDPTSIRKLGIVLQWMVWGFMLCVILAQLAKWFVDTREKNLNASLAVQRESALEARFQSSQDELSQVRTEVRVRLF
jgi:hypothetical protein